MHSSIYHQLLNEACNWLKTNGISPIRPNQYIFVTIDRLYPGGIHSFLITHQINPDLALIISQFVKESDS